MNFITAKLIFKHKPSDSDLDKNNKEIMFSEVISCQ